MRLSPIALFVYNRPVHTSQTVEALQRNELANESDLVIFSDAPKSQIQYDAVREVRQYIRQIDGFKSVSIIEREKNFGLANSIIDGVTTIVNKHGRIIVLEDDLVTSPYFLRYMNDALDLYKSEEKVISIHGYMFPVTVELPETFFLRDPGCWGWATWKRGWDLFESDGNKLRTLLKKGHLDRDFNFSGSYDYMGMLDSQIAGNNDSWAVRWYASAFLLNKLTLYPGKSLVQNIGNDGSGQHGGKSDNFTGKIAAGPVRVGGCVIEESVIARAALIKYLMSIRESWMWKLARNMHIEFRKVCSVVTSKWT